MPVKNFSPVIETETKTEYTITNPFGVKTYLSSMVVIPNDLFKLYGNVTIRIEKNAIVTESDKDLLRSSELVTYPTSTLVINPYDKIYIDLESTDPTAKVGIAVLIVMSTEPLPLNYQVEPANPAQIKALFSNVDGERVIFEDKSRDVGDEYALVNMQGYKNVYATLISRKNELTIDNSSFELKYPEVYETFFKNAQNLYIRINRQDDPAPDFSLQISLRFRTSLVGTLKPATLVTPTIRFGDGAQDGQPYEGAVFDLSVTDSGYYTYLRFKVDVKDIPENMNKKYATTVFDLDGTGAEIPNSYTSFGYEITYTNQPETGNAYLKFEINANDIWVELDDLPNIYVNANNTNTVLVGEYSGHILPSGANILRAKLETKNAPVRTEVVLLRV